MSFRNDLIKTRKYLENLEKESPNKKNLYDVEGKPDDHLDDPLFWFTKFNKIKLLNNNCFTNSINNAIRFIEFFDSKICFTGTKHLIIELKNVLVSEYITKNEFIYWFQTVFWKEVINEQIYMDEIRKERKKEMRELGMTAYGKSNALTELNNDCATMYNFLQNLQKGYNTIESIETLLQNIYIVISCESKIHMSF
jgi:hypothetical protein